MHQLIPIAAAALFASLPAAQDRRGPVHKPVRFAPVEGNEDATNLVVKFVEGSHVRLRGGSLVDGDGQTLAATMRTLATALSVERLFQRSERELADDRTALLQRLAGRPGIDPPADLDLYVRVRLPNATAGIAAWRALAADPLVETVLADTPPGYDADPTDIPPTTPNFAGMQGYWDASPLGIDAAVARKIPGGRGEELQVLDIETGLIVDHEDIPLGTTANIIGPNPMPRDHGQAVAGMLVAAKNGYGVHGGVWKARYKFHSHQGLYWASSVNVAAANSQPGDIIVLEVQLPCPVTGNSDCPMEGRQDVFDAVRNATLAGIHVVGVAGNGNQDLDNPVFLGAFNRAVRDSGGIIVGATDGPNLVRAVFSNYGNIVDGNGWGTSITTTGYGGLFDGGGDPRQRYTGWFSHTSGATPIVASAVAATISAAKFQLGQVLAPAQARAMVRTHGVSVTSVGRRPDLQAMFQALGLPAGLTLAAEVGTGQTVTLNFTAAPNEVALVLGALSGVASTTPFGRLLLPAASAVPLGVYAQSGTHLAPVPANPALRDGEVHWQVALLNVTTGAIRLTNSVVSHFEQ